MKRWIITALIICMVGGVVWAQLPSKRFEWITVANGLPTATVTHALEDRRGFLWLGTRHGLIRYDGYDFVSVNGEQISGLSLSSAADRLWATLDDGQLLTIQPVSRTTQPVHIRSGEGTSIYNAFADSFGQVWFSDSISVSRYDPIRRVRYRYPMKQTTYKFHKGYFLEDKRRNIWVLGLEVGLFRFDRIQNRLVCVFGLDCPRSDLSMVGEELRKGFVDRQNSLWIPLVQGRLLHFDPRTNRLRQFSMPGHQLLVATEGSDEQGRPIIWLGSSEGLGVFRPDTEKVYWFDVPVPGSPLGKNLFMVNDIFRSPRNGHVWICTNKGLLHYNPYRQAVQSYQLTSTNTRQPPRASAFLRDRTDPSGQTYWLAVAFQGLLRWNRHDNTTHLFPFPAPYAATTEALWLVQDSENCIYIGGNQTQTLTQRKPNNRFEGLFRFDPSHERYVSMPFSAHRAFFSVPYFSMGLLDSRNRFWLVNHYEGVHVLNPSSGKPLILWQKSAHDTFMQHDNWIMDVFEDSHHRIWFATYRGLWYFDETTGRFVDVNRHHRGNTFRGSNALLKVTEDRQGNLWVVGWHLLAKVAPDGCILRQWTKSEGLYDPECRLVATDAQNRVWIGSADGLLCFDELSGTFRRLSVNDGLLSDDATGGMYLANSRELFVGNQNGWNVVNIKQIDQTIPAAIVQLSEVRVNDQGIPFRMTEALNLTRTQNSLSFTFSALNYEHSNQNQYACRLDGWDDSWHVLGFRREINYSNLPPNKYIFRVRLADAPEPTTTSLAIVIAPHFHETTWFNVLIFLLTALVIVVIYSIRQKYRLLAARLQTEEAQRKQKEAELREQDALFQRQLADTEMTALRAQMNPHFIFNCLNSIKLYTLENDADRASEYLTKFSRLIRLVLDNSRSEQVSLQNELEALQLYIELEAMRFKHKLQYSIQVDPAIDQQYLRIPPLLLQPYVENAIWHGLMHKPEGGTITIEVKQPQENLLHIEIADDGVGRQRAAALKSKSAGKHKSFGMQVTADRIRMINQLYNTQTQAQIVDLVDSEGEPCGTRVILRIPV